MGNLSSTQSYSTNKKDKKYNVMDEDDHNSDYNNKPTNNGITNLPSARPINLSSSKNSMDELSQVDLTDPFAFNNGKLQKSNDLTLKKN